MCPVLSKCILQECFRVESSQGTLWEAKHFAETFAVTHYSRDNVNILSGAVTFYSKDDINCLSCAVTHYSGSEPNGVTTQNTYITKYILYRGLPTSSREQFLFKFKVCKFVHHHTVQLNHPNRCNNFSSLLLEVYVQLNMFRASSRQSSGAQQLK